ncbi:hypothetical protein IU438_18740 [Nocardia cyriacigeorgica]|uniref:hypothetical protein n=1 Tax=Nocardia cyriacigeorgica TaxID=135487 RepID=UPI0018943D21|nr:hypothetical protein [Nocardia cyriacigeorgica]MBF6397830.1 hypothetical protein [Nocardia cyriacigeorgica]MBF6402512.1 hypothetical protein [Nocardia cyriacigeorgica]
MAKHLRGLPGESMMTCLANLWADRAGLQPEWTLQPHTANALLGWLAMELPPREAA